MIPKILVTQKPWINVTSILIGICAALFTMSAPASANWQTPTVGEYSKVPPFVSTSASPLVMLVVGRNHKLYYEAYNDASDLDEDGKIDVGYKPDDIDYYGYFDSYKYYQYNSGVFEPVGTTTDKKVPGGGSYWSGDFLNYLTMSRMDAIRKVLYGGYRSTDTASETVLERAYIPQDAHTWGKEYESFARDGYRIEDYAPLTEPPSTPIQLRHLFASTSIVDYTDGAYEPLLRVLPNNPNRIWEWVAKERPVADDSLESAGATTWQVVPDDATMGISGVTVLFYDITAAGGAHPGDNAAYDTFVSTYATAGNLQNTGGVPLSVSTIDGSGNPFIGSNDNYMALFNGTLNIPADGNYTFAVDGDDAVEFLIDLNNDGDVLDPGEDIVGWYGGHARCICNTHSATVALTAGTYNFQYRHEEAGGDDFYHLRWGFGTPSSTITDYTVRVKVADATMPEGNCKLYPNGNYKPTGLLQRYGEPQSMYFGLMSGSYDKNTSGGVLRKNISDINDEINPNDGTWTAVNGIIGTLDHLRIAEFSHADHTYEPGWDGAWETDGPMTEGQFPDWGNPVGEIMYESLRYFGGKGSPTSDFIDASMPVDTALGLPTGVAWVDPYDPSTGFPRCAKPFMLVLSDINPTYDSDQLPGNPFNGFAGDLAGLNVSARAQTITTEEGISGNFYIGEQNGSTADGTCNSQTLSHLGDIRGLCPEEPTKQGSYYSASVAYYGVTEDINPVADDQKVASYMVGLASPLPRIEIPVGGQIITVVPFAKSVGGCLGITPDPATDFQPTNTIVDFFVETIDPDNPTYGKFRINYEDVEQAADHDMDAIVEYEYQVYESDGVTPAATPASGALVRITLTSTYAAGCVIQHLGYAISGTDGTDGPYLVVRDYDTGVGGDEDYFLDTPNIAGALPITDSRDFYPGTTTATTLLENPFWYAAKYGGFEDLNGNDLPDQQNEWDEDGDGIPDTYFYVTNPLRLEQQLNRSFDAILARGSSGTAASVISNSRSGEGAIYQSIFYPSLTVSPNTVEWVGQVHALLVDSNGNLREDTNQNQALDIGADKFLVFDGGTVYRHWDLDQDSVLDPAEAADTSDAVQIPNVRYLWSSNNWLNESPMDPINQRTYSSNIERRYIFTFVDENGNMVADTNEQQPFQAATEPTWTQATATDLPYAYMHTHEPFAPPIPTSNADFQDMVTRQTKRIVDYVRGQDQTTDTVGSVSLPAFRSRQIDYDNDATVETWRMGDVVHSTPKLVGQPFEKYDLVFRDETYTTFYKQYRYRRNMIYVGANDGMLHAFNAGFFSASTNSFTNQPVDIYGSPVTEGGSTGIGGSFWNWDLGAEAWAYVPFNLLPHLYWLTDVDYPHVYYNDIEPKIFDAKIFPPSNIHPEGWGTVLVGGMRFGGGKIAADLDKSDGGVYDASVDRVMSSAYYILDITNPEVEPTVMAEITFPDLGYTTCFPAVIPIREKVPAAGAGVFNENQWYLVFGSGPTSGGANGPDYTAAQTGVSEQNAVMYAIDMVRLGTNGELWSVLSDGSKKQYNPSDAGPYYLTRFAEARSSVSEPISVDWALDFTTDAVYFGLSSGDNATGWSGKLRRIVLQADDDSDPDPANWELDSTLIDLSATTLAGLTPPVANGQPIMAAATAGLDKKGQRWLFFGTGRYYSQQDGANTEQQSYYGIKEPYTGAMGSFDFDYSEVVRNDLLDVTTAKVYNTGNYVDLGGATTFTNLKLLVDGQDGWVMDLQDWTAGSERNLGQAVLAGDLLTFTTYKPSTDTCTSEGQTNLYALYYLTGTAYTKSVIGLDIGDVQGGEARVLKRLDLGDGLSITPNIHVGRETGSTAYIQSSTGAINALEQINPGRTKSGKQYWSMDESACP